MRGATNEARGAAYRVPRRGAEEHGLERAELVARDPFLAHLALHERLVRGKVDRVSDRLAPERRDLALVDALEPVRAVDFPHRVQRAAVERVRGRLCLQP
jgi:hypothetical protein